MNWTRDLISTDGPQPRFEIQASGTSNDMDRLEVPREVNVHAPEIKPESMFTRVKNATVAFASRNNPVAACPIV